MPFKSKSQRRKFYALKSQGKMDQKTIDEWESGTPKNIPERIEKMAGFFEGFEKRALSGKVKAGLALGGATLGSLGVAKAMQPHDTTHQLTDIYSDHNTKGTAKRPPVHMTISKKRPLFFGRLKHMEQAKKPERAMMAMGSPIHSAAAARAIAKKSGGKLTFTPEYRKDFLEAQRKRPFLSAGGKSLDEAQTGKFYDAMTRVPI